MIEQQFIPFEFCLKCLGCCRFSEPESIWRPTLLEEEIEGIMKNGFPPSVVSSDKRIRALPSEKQDCNYVCTFLNCADNRCKIYGFRPFECQLYPFLINLKGKKIYLAVDLHCPFMKDIQKKKEFKEYAKRLETFLLNPKGRNMLRSNPQVLQEYPEALNLIELEI